MINLDKHEWELSKSEKYAISWFEEHDFDVVINKRYLSKTIFTVIKNGISDKFELPTLDDIICKEYMNKFSKNWELYCELQHLRSELKQN